MFGYAGPLFRGQRERTAGTGGDVAPPLTGVASALLPPARRGKKRGASSQKGKRAKSGCGDKDMNGVRGLLLTRL